MTISRRNILGAAGTAVMANILPVRAEMPSKEGDMTQHLRATAVETERTVSYTHL